MARRIDALSERALFLAAALGIGGKKRLARWLYQFGTVPRGPEVERNFGHGDDAMGVLGLTPGGAARVLLEETYEVTTFPGWLSFTSELAPIVEQAAFKLYVSPHPTALATAFPVIAEVFKQMNVRSFKVGRGIEGLLRPDKLVAYFNDHATLHGVARTLGQRLAGCPAQPVPFTAETVGGGLLSWASDPPLGSDGLSWRAWITRRLAEGMLGRCAASPSGAVANALRHVATLGVDGATWTISQFPAAPARTWEQGQWT